LCVGIIFLRYCCIDGLFSVEIERGMGILEKQLGHGLVIGDPGDEDPLGINIDEVWLRGCLEAQGVGFGGKPHVVAFYLSMTVDVDGYRKPVGLALLGLLQVEVGCAGSRVIVVPDIEYRVAWPVIPLIKEPGKVETANLLQSQS